MSMGEAVRVTSPEGWVEIRVRTRFGVARYAETAEIDDKGRRVFEFIGHHKSLGVGGITKAGQEAIDDD